MIRLTSVTPEAGFKLRLSYDDGAKGVVDLSDFAGRGVFAVWSDPAVFNEARVNESGAVEWPGEIDLCADMLYLRLTGKTVEELMPGFAAHA